MKDTPQADLCINNKRAKSAHECGDGVSRQEWFKSSDCAAQHIFIEISVQYCTAGMLHFINLSKSSYKGWYINKDIYQNADSDS